MNRSHAMRCVAVWVSGCKENLVNSELEALGTAGHAGVQLAKVSVLDVPAGDDCRLGGKRIDARLGEGPVNSTFVCNGTDSLAGLAVPNAPAPTFVVGNVEWQREAPREAMAYADAWAYCRGLSLAGGREPGKRWRLPDGQQLVELMEAGDGEAALPPSDARRFWGIDLEEQTRWAIAISAWDLEGESAWTVFNPHSSFAPGHVLSISHLDEDSNIKNMKFRVRCSRVLGATSPSVSLGK